MDLPMAVRVEQHMVRWSFAAAVDLADDMVVVPLRRPRDRLATARAAPALPLPQGEEVGTICQQAYHLGVRATLEVRPPGRIVGVRLPFHLHMPSDGDVAGVEQPGYPPCPTDVGF